MKRPQLFICVALFLSLLVIYQVMTLCSLHQYYCLPSNINNSNNSLKNSHEELIEKQSGFSCQSSLNDVALSMSNLVSPPHSPSWNKCKQILSNATQFHIVNPVPIFSDTTENIVTMLTSYGLARIENNTIDSDLLVTSETIILEYSFFGHDKTFPSCSGTKCNNMSRIIIQTEQLLALKWAKMYIIQCHTQPNCVVWDFSDTNYKWSQNPDVNASDSFMVIPHMFHDRLRHTYPSSEVQLLPYAERTVDVVFFGLITSRRYWFEQNYLTENKTLASYNVVYGKNMRSDISNVYQNAKICLVLHSYTADSAAEFHRLSDFKRFGCIPIMETTSGDTIVMNSLMSCAGLKTADYDNLAKTVVKELNQMNETNFDVLRSQQLSYDRWWAKGIDWENYLQQVLGPRV